MKRFSVEYLDDDKDTLTYGEWVSVPLDMCHGKILCPECRKLGKASDDCDYLWYHTFCEQIALDKKKYLEGQGLKARIVIKGGK